MMVFHDLHNHLKINNLIQGDNLHTQTNEVNHNIDYEYQHIFLLEFLILIKLVELKKISFLYINSKVLVE